MSRVTSKWPTLLSIFFFTFLLMACSVGVFLIGMIMVGVGSWLGFD